jgi:lysyl-tRNA synthetase class 2
LDLEFLELRAAVFRQIRSFFDRRGFLEVDTPVLAPDLIPETCLEVFRTEYLVPGGKRPRPYWLVPSPEIWMKKLIAKHRKSVYQICRCFRNGESAGFLHSPEFTMLEYYTVGFDYLDSLKLTEELFGELRQALFPENTLFPENKDPGGKQGGGFLRLSVEDAFREFAGVDLFGAAEAGSLGEEARRLGLEIPDGLDTQTIYDLIFIHAVEPRLPKDAVTALLDYPAFVPCLAKPGRDGKTVERWEIYGRGVELANCYSEETRPETVRNYFEEEGKAKNKTALAPHRIDGGYWKLFAPGPGKQPFPECSGVAMGLDRLIMALAGRSSIDAVLPFPMSISS